MSDSSIAVTDSLSQQPTTGPRTGPTNLFIEFKEEEIEQSIPDRFEKIVAQHPDRIAVKTKNSILTYKALNQAANRVARAILAQHGERSEPIALLFEEGTDLITAIFGVLKAGKFFLALDPSLPLERITYMLDDSQACSIITNDRIVGFANKLRQDSRQLLNLDELNDSFSTANLDLTLAPDTLSHLIYTSGSTGKPKGVLQNHLNMLHEIMAYTNSLHICAQDRLTLLASCSSGQGIKNAFCALLNGAGLYPLDIKSEGVARLANHLAQEEITVYHSSVTLYRNFVKSLTEEEKFPRLRLIRLASQQVLKEDVELYKQYFSPSCILVNALSSTETGTFRWLFMNKETVISSSTAPVGYAVEDKNVVLLDDNGQEVGFNRVGEIAVKSRYLSPGYWRRPDLTQAAFMPDPEGRDKRIYRTGDIGLMRPDGCLEHRGRKDFQVKIRGYRIAASEIEMALIELVGIKEAVVVAREDPPSYQRLIAYVVPTQGQAPTTTEVRRFLKTKFPEYMIPSTFVFLEALPLTPNGKVDRRALPNPGKFRPELETPFVAATTPVEKQLVPIWAEVLVVDQVGIYDNFFELGGHSLLATQVISRVRDTFQVELPLRTLFENPTVAALAAQIAETQAKKFVLGEMADVLADLESLSDEEAQHLLAQEDPKEI